MSKEQKQKKAKEPKSISIEDHKRELATKDEAIAQIKAEMQRVKSAALASQKEYKERFDLQNQKLELMEVKFKAEKQVHESIVADLEKKMDKLNEKHGATVKKLRDQLAVAHS